MKLHHFRNASFFDTFSGNFDDRIFKSSVKKFQLDLFNTNLSIKIPIDAPEIYYTPKREYRIPTNSYGIINPKELIKCEVNNPRYVDAISIFIDPRTIQEVLHGLNINNILRPTFLDKSSQSIYFSEIPVGLHANTLGHFLKSIRSIKPGQLKTKSFFYTLVELLVQAEKPNWHKINNIQAIKTSTKVEIFRRMEMARECMHDIDLQEISISHLSQMIQMTEYNFIRSFKSVYRVTPYQYFLKTKISKAKELLVRDSSIAEVAHRLGFANSSSFGKCFRKITGMTPTSYRNGD